MINLCKEFIPGFVDFLYCVTFLLYECSTLLVIISFLLLSLGLICSSLWFSCFFICLLLEIVAETVDFQLF